MRIASAWASRPCRGERVNGDAVVVRAFGERTLFAVVDALGHGAPAHAAAEAARSFLLERVSAADDVEAILRGLDVALRGTRGAAATICAFEGGRLSVSGVGNVELRCRDFSWAPAPGIVGARIRRVRVDSGELPHGARVFLFSDGIAQPVDIEPVARLPLEDACRHVLGRHGVDHDDATILICEVDGQ